MLYRTHKAGGTLGMLVAFEVARQHGLLLPNVNEFVQLLIMYPAASWGATAPDLDHHWGSVKEKTPFNLLVHKILHLSKPTHRSWQTHSILVTGGFCALLYALVMLGDTYFGVGALGSFDWVILRLVVMGVLVGIASHLILDAMSTAGIWIYPGLKLRFVPKTSFFATGSGWETFVYYVCIISSFLLVLNIFLGFFDINLISLTLDWMEKLKG